MPKDPKKWKGRAVVDEEAKDLKRLMREKAAREMAARELEFRRAYEVRGLGAPDRLRDGVAATLQLALALRERIIRRSGKRSSRSGR